MFLLCNISLFFPNIDEGGDGFGTGEGVGEEGIGVEGVRCGESSSLLVSVRHKVGV